MRLWLVGKPKILAGDISTKWKELQFFRFFFIIIIRLPLFVLICLRFHAPFPIEREGSRRGCGFNRADSDILSFPSERSSRWLKIVSSSTVSLFQVRYDIFSEVGQVSRNDLMLFLLPSHRSFRSSPGSSCRNTYSGCHRKDMQSVWAATAWLLFGNRIRRIDIQFEIHITKKMVPKLLLVISGFFN